MKPTALALAALLALTACNNQPPSEEAPLRDTAGKGGSQPNGARPLELVFQDNAYQFTGLAKEEGGRLLVNYPRWSGLYRYGVVEAVGKDGVRPYPDSLFNQWGPGQAGANRWVCVQSVYFDPAGTLWVLDPAAPALKVTTGGGPKLVQMDKATGRIARSYPLGKAVSDTSYVNDVRVDPQAGFAYMTDSKTGGIVVLNLKTGAAREVLKGHPSTLSDPAYRFTMDGRELLKDGKPAKFNSDGIALTPDGQWLYYKPLTDDKLYRIRTADLRDETLSEGALGAKVEDLGHKCTTDGMIFDKAGNLYLGDIQRFRIVRLAPDGAMTTLVEDKRLLWPDSYSIADGYLYLTCSQIHLQPEYNNGVNKRTTPYAVYRLKL